MNSIQQAAQAYQDRDAQASRKAYAQSVINDAVRHTLGLGHSPFGADKITLDGSTATREEYLSPERARRMEVRKPDGTLCAVETKVDVGNFGVDRYAIRRGEEPLTRSVPPQIPLVGPLLHALFGLSCEESAGSRPYVEFESAIGHFNVVRGCEEFSPSLVRVYADGSAVLDKVSPSMDGPIELNQIPDLDSFGFELSPNR